MYFSVMLLRPVQITSHVLLLSLGMNFKTIFVFQISRVILLSDCEFTNPSLRLLTRQVNPQSSLNFIQPNTILHSAPVRLKDKPIGEGQGQTGSGPNEDAFRGSICGAKP